MIDFPAFCQEVLTQTQNALPPSGLEGECFLQKIRKLNECYTGLIIRKKDQSITSAVKLDRYYREYLRGKDMRQIVEDILKMSGKTDSGIFESIPDVMKSYELVKPRLFIRISNKNANRELLETIPHHSVLDLAISYHVRLKEIQGQKASILIQKDLLASWSISEAQLHQDATENSMKTMPWEVLPIQEVIQSGGGPAGLIRDAAPMPLYVVRSRDWGSAAALFYPGTMEKLAEMAGGNYYILPSSVHEVLMLPTRELSDLTSLKTMVREINQSMVGESDRLSDNVYLYKSRKKKLEIV